jgi:outer membrane protein assembly factor BamE (lipoprotein component of BamABCDE complex)
MTKVQNRKGNVESQKFVIVSEVINGNKKTFCKYYHADHEDYSGQNNLTKEWSSEMDNHWDNIDDFEEV